MKVLRTFVAGLVLVVSLFSEESTVSLESGAVVKTEVIPDSVETKTGASLKATKTVKSGFEIFHVVDGENLIVQVSYKTSGWVAIGFNPSKKMMGANIIMGYSADGKGVVEDHFGTEKVAHEDDTKIGGKNSITSSKCWEKEGVTFLWLSLPLDSGDEKDVILKKGEKVKLIMAAGKSDDTKKRHSTRAHVELIL